jgi:hypothetical protein
VAAPLTSRAALCVLALLDGSTGYLIVDSYMPASECSAGSKASSAVSTSSAVACS